VVTFDSIVELPESQGFNAITTGVDKHTKMIKLTPTTTDITSAGTADIYLNSVWKHFRLAEKIITDQGSQFASEFTRELNRLLGIETALSTAFHPQTDSQSERTNQVVEQYLRLFCNERQNDWARWLPLAEFCYNNWENASTHQTPFFLNYGYHPRMGIEPRWKRLTSTLSA
jgi:hypothetical protein